MKLNIQNEYNKLTKVLLSPVENEYKKEQQELLSILKKYNVKVFFTEKGNNKYQIFTRDPIIVIDNKILINNMAEVIRKDEIFTLNGILSKIPSTKKIYVPEDTIIEGGDIIIHNNIIFVGQNGNRTNQKGVDFLKKHFGTKYKIIPLYLLNPSQNIPFIHLDCSFNPISAETVILYPQVFNNESLQIIKEIFPNIITVSKQEQEQLATNVFSLGNNTIIVQKRHLHLIKELTRLGFQVEEMNHYETVKETGYIRCLTCPLERK